MKHHLNSEPMEERLDELSSAMKMTQKYFAQVVVTMVVKIIYDISLQNYGRSLLGCY